MTMLGENERQALSDVEGIILSSLMLCEGLGALGASCDLKKEHYTSASVGAFKLMEMALGSACEMIGDITIKFPD